MALQFDYTLPQGIELTNAYANIINFTGNKKSISLKVALYANAQARIDGLEPITILHHSIDLANGATMEEMYYELKTQRFAGAIDC